MQTSSGSNHRQVTLVTPSNQQVNANTNQPVVVALNDRLYANSKVIFETKQAQLISKFSQSFLQEIIRHTTIQQTNYNIQRQSNQPQNNQQNLSSSVAQPLYFFQGYPQGNFLKQVCVILSLWKQASQFPISFKKMPGLSETDDTDKFIETLNKLTPMVIDVFKEVNQVDRSPRALQKELLDFFIALEPAGFLLCLGLRRTAGSQDLLPPERKSLVDSFTRLYMVQTEDELKRSGNNPPIITVGARAMQKHAPRSSEGFWGPQSGLNDRQRNENAVKTVNKVLNECIWINIHTFNSKSTINILEIRESKGYGARWSLDGCEFRGLVEPQISGGHDKKWIH
ncbi:UNKNOWN [Stylonychia lemnae]|uniref:Uncharacterized protein n=1 Tax=Stylonychia lemnae TaxID=5949 RepID=A0A078AP86_STYLE|nr:UNKNOWN [Stylonychia lemnae]|eukprot:CDW83132.1 UNKNOWN [Stylonychia lemnae]